MALATEGARDEHECRDREPLDGIVMCEKRAEGKQEIEQRISEIRTDPAGREQMLSRAFELAHEAVQRSSAA